MSRRLAGFALLVAAAGAFAQPPAADPGPQSPLDLARGLRDAGMPDLALDYLKELAGKPLPDAIKAELPLERARCLVDAADAEPDEGARGNRVADARAAFAAFLQASPDHPRAAEAYLALARLASLEGKSLLARARRVDLPADGAARDEAASRQRAEAAKARPKFDEAAKRFDDAARRIEAQAAKTPPGPARRDLDRAGFDARLEAGVSRLTRADTYLHPTADDRADRVKDVEAARDAFAALARDTATPPRVAHVARAWMAECLWEKEEGKAAEEEAAKVLSATAADAEDGKRVARFHRLRRKFGEAVAGATVKGFEEAEKLARDWLRDYGRDRRAAGDAVAARWYLGYTLQGLADAQVPRPKAPPKAGTPEPAPVVPAAARLRYAEAERLYRQVAQTDTEYAARAARQRLAVVRRLLGDAGQPPAAYGTFEEAQMAALIHLGRIAELEKAGNAADEVKDRRQQAVALLERARELAGPADSPADLADVNLRLVVYYLQTGRPDRAAVLGEAVARAARPGTRPATAGALAVNAYAAAAGSGLAPDRLDAARRADRDRAVRLARYVDERFPADPATDRVRHRLAGLLYEDGKPVDALQVLFKVGAGYDEVGAARLFEGALASQVLAARDLPLADDARRDVFRRAVGHLADLPRPPADAPAEDAREYLTARCRLALVYLHQPRSDPEAEKAEGGVGKARKVAEEALGLVPSFTALVRAGTKEVNADGLELLLLAEDARTRAAVVAGQTLFAQGKYDDAYGAIGLILAEMKEKGPYADVVRKAAGSPPPAAKKEPAPKADEPKKEEPKKDEPTADDPEGAGEPDPGAAAQGRALKLAEGIDRFRRDLVLLAVKIRVKQGRADQGVEQLDLLRSYGGGLDGNPAALRQLAADLGGQVRDLRRAGKADEANALAGAFGKLLDGVAAAPNLPPSTRLLVGQALSLVGEYGKAEAVLRAVPGPADRGLLAKPLADLDEAGRRQVLDYRRAVLELVRALRQAKKYPEAEAELQGAMGPPGQPGWGFNSLEVRREVAYLAEARGADAPTPAEARKFWGEAIKEWGTVAAAARKPLEKPPPKDARGNPNNAAVLRDRNAFYDAFFESNRCVVRANAQLLKGNPKLQATWDNVGKKFAEVERAAGADLTAEVKAKYADLLAELPELKKAYEAAGGKLFLERPPGGM